MNRFNFIFAVLLTILVGCAHYKTDENINKPALQPRLLNGSLSELKSVVIDAAQMAFPDETNSISVDENGNTTILREWFWRGDTLITVFIENKGDDEFIINVESKASWHRLNPSGLDVSEQEVVDFYDALDKVYESYLATKNNDTQGPTNKRSLDSKLKELKIAFDDGLITETEYKEKRKAIIDDF